VGGREGPAIGGGKVGPATFAGGRIGPENFADGIEGPYSSSELSPTSNSSGFAFGGGAGPRVRFSVGAAAA
jgi:hypothetical protein